MSNKTAYTNVRLPQKSFDHSINIQDLIRQNQQLKQSIEELIEQNNQLTQIIEQLSNQHHLTKDNIPNINQEEIQALAHQVISLQKELERQKQKKNKPYNQYDGDAEQTIKIIEELSTEFQAMQEHYKIQIQKLQAELNSQKTQSKAIFQGSEERFNRTLNEYNAILNKLKVKDEIITDLQRRLTQSLQASKNQPKISTTTQDLRQTLQAQIQQKEHTIKLYEELIKNLKAKLSEKI